MTIHYRRPTRRAVFQALAIATVTMLAAFGLLVLYVYKESVGKFEIRRLSLPTRIFTDFTPLVPGVVLGPDDLIEKLDRLGFRQATALGQPGDYVPGSSQVDLFTRPFNYRNSQYPAQSVRVLFTGSTIQNIVSLGSHGGVVVMNAALEPELLTSILGDQLENRRPVTLAQVPQVLQDAVIATEDVRFWHHPGVDPIGVLRAMFRNLRHGAIAEGGSTLTQQLVKNYYLTPERSFKRKLIEAFMAVVLDARYSKREILEAYLNDIYLGRNRSISIIGVGEASHFYFGKPVTEITLAEAALLASMIPSPNHFSPFVRPDMALTRRNTVLGLMLDQKKITQQAFDQARNVPLPNKPSRERIGLNSIPYYVDRVLQEMARDYGIKDVKGRGLQIYTAIDLNDQDLAARTLEAGLEGIEKRSRRLRRPDNPLQGVLIHVDVAAGEIRALVGGRNYDQSQFNRALTSKRLIGSLIKPFVYLTAFEPSVSNQNITPATLVSDTRFVYKRPLSDDWSPHNFGDVYHGTVTVREALEESMNSASVRIGLACGIAPVIRTAHALGIESPIDDHPAMLLGAVDIPPIEMADAYTTIARLGSRLPLHTIRFVTDDRGQEVTGDAVKPVQVFPARDVFMVVNVMKGVVDRGTAEGVRSLGFRAIAAGKTGTTNDARDAWFIGFTPQTLTLTWVGFDDDKVTGLSGGEAAVPIWTRYMIPVTAGQPNNDFLPPEGIAFMQIDETSGGLATPQCPKESVVNEAFKSGMQPIDVCPLHSPQAPPPPAVDSFGNPVALDTSGAVPPPTEYPSPPVPPGATLTGGVFPTNTAPPPVTLPPAPPSVPTDTSSTSTAPPPTGTTATTTASPPGR